MNDQKHREISVSEFFEKNKHLLGFDNKTKALMMIVKEAVDNALDACEEARILPDVKVVVKELGDERFQITVEDNGPGIEKKHIPNIFGKFLFGSKFHRLRQSRGQQGIGIKASVLYAQLTTGKPVKVWSRPINSDKTYFFELMIDTTKNRPKVFREEELESGKYMINEHGTRIQLEVRGRYRARQGIDDYLEGVSLINPFARITYINPKGEKIIFQRSYNELPKIPKEIRPHPYGVELGILMRMLSQTKARTLLAFLVSEFSRVGATSAKEMCSIAKLNPSSRPQELSRDEAERLWKAMQKVKLQKPPIDCLSPVGAEALEKGLRKKYPEAEFIVAVTRPPTVYRGNPFQIEAALVYSPKDFPQDNTVKLFRFANRVPLLYQQGACALTKAVMETSWKRYGLQQSQNSLPIGPVEIMVHIVSAWVPFSSESKEAVAQYPDIINEAKLALQELGRKLGRYLAGKRRASEAKRRIMIFERYSVEVSEALSILTGIKKEEIQKMFEDYMKKKSVAVEVGE